jgi:hypothetical protein
VCLPAPLTPQVQVRNSAGKNPRPNHKPKKSVAWRKVKKQVPVEIVSVTFLVGEFYRPITDPILALKPPCSSHWSMRNQVKRQIFLPQFQNPPYRLQSLEILKCWNSSQNFVQQADMPPFSPQAKLNSATKHAGEGGVAHRTRKGIASRRKNRPLRQAGLLVIGLCSIPFFFLP